VIAQQTTGRDAVSRRNTQAQRERARYIDKILDRRRERLPAHRSVKAPAEPGTQGYCPHRPDLAADLRRISGRCGGFAADCPPKCREHWRIAIRDCQCFGLFCPCSLGVGETEGIGAFV
jgi:hypothetical protein